MIKRISVIIPNRNGADTIGDCLKAVFASEDDNFDVTVIDDCSDDDSIEIISRYPCKLIRLKVHAGASRARNVGARAVDGDILFFTDSDCLLTKNTLAIARRSLTKLGGNFIVGGTYTKKPFDPGFFSMFQSVFINYSETKKADDPAYIAGHAMAIYSRTFSAGAGFNEDVYPILEDVDFSAMMKAKGYKLIIDPAILVRHIFNFSFTGSIRNAFTKARYWARYSATHGDLFTDSGTASLELKTTAMLFFASTALIITGFALDSITPFYLAIAGALLWTGMMKKQLATFLEAGGAFFALLAAVYYFTLFQLSASAGALTGIATAFCKTGKKPDAGLAPDKEQS
ncbi:hypothetical protein MNBD_NITROSPINAE03-1579 [hydrothermal vent metagenome]|uniref:Glycosyltransferase 2-like domain-containing protein n=1 Tax=hydrothermal vent metagenome TaxID=652676 RepID=A0A3B1CV27_9ZZZZ